MYGIHLELHGIYVKMYGIHIEMHGIHLEMHGIHMESMWKCKTFIRSSQADDLVTCYVNTHQCLDQSSYQPTPTSYFRPTIRPRPSCDERMINRFSFWVPGELSCVCVAPTLQHLGVC